MGTVLEQVMAEQKAAGGDLPMPPPSELSPMREEPLNPYLNRVVVPAALTEDVVQEDGSYGYFIDNGQVLNLKLSSNPSTGYSWIVKMPENSECIEMLERDYVANSRKVPGARGTEILKFKANGSGCTEHVMISYGRSWAFDWASAPEANTHKLKIEVSGPPKEKKDDNLLVFKMFEVAKGANGKKSVQVPAGKKVGLWARSNPTTGFQWLVNVPGGKCVKKVDQKYRMDDRGYPKAGQPALMGVGGASTIIFEPVGEPGCKETVQLAYSQPWNFPGFDNKSVPNRGQFGELSNEEVFEIEVTAPMTVKTLKSMRTDAENVYDLRVKANSQVQVSFPGNPTTGYKWNLEPTEKNSCIQLVSREFKRDPVANDDMVGVGGTEVMTFKHVGEENCSETLWAYYAQPWTFQGFDQAGKDQGVFDKINVQVMP